MIAILLACLQLIYRQMNDAIFQLVRRQLVEVTCSAFVNIGLYDH